MIAPYFVRFIVGYAYPKERLGWSRKESHSLQVQQVEEAPGQFRAVSHRFYKDGFKRWGNVNADTKILILGDSVTEMIYVSNGEEWYGYLENEFKQASFFVYGGSGYGTLQQFMVLDDYFDVIKPDVIIWQFNENDYANNYYDYDRLFYPGNNLGWRPYFEKGEIVYRMPMPLAVWRERYPIVDQFMVYYDGHLRNRFLKDPVFRRKVTKKKDGSAGEVLRPKALDTTLAIFKMVRERAGSTPVYLFNSVPNGLHDSRICEQFGFYEIEGLASHLRLKEKEGLDVHAEDTFRHWNYSGNRIVAEYLIDFFKKDPMFQATIQTSGTS